MRFGSARASFDFQGDSCGRMSHSHRAVHVMRWQGLGLSDSSTRHRSGRGYVQPSPARSRPAVPSCTEWGHCCLSRRMQSAGSWSWERGQCPLRSANPIASERALRIHSLCGSTPRVLAGIGTSAGFDSSRWLREESGRALCRSRSAPARFGVSAHAVSVRVPAR